MLKNYVLIALRTLTKQKLYAALNVLGLALGLACTLLILAYVRHELRFDRFHTHADRIFRVVQRQPGNIFLGSDQFAVTPAALARTLLEAFPEVTEATTLQNQSVLLGFEGRHFYEEGLRADARFFDVFTFPLLRGNPETALAEPDGILLAASLAQKIFGDEDPLGQRLQNQNQDVYTVTGVLRDVPETSHLRFSFVTALAADPYYVRNLEASRWNSNSWYTYFVLADGAPVEQLAEKMPAFVATYLPEKDDPDKQNQYFIQALPDIHLRSRVNFEVSPNGDVRYVYLFSIIALVILLLACVNYTNLAVARSIQRAREVGMRKVVGAHRIQLVGQFLGESVLMAFLALGGALVLAALLLPVFGRLVDRPLHLGLLEGGFLPGLLVLVLGVGLIAGSYPALFMAAQRPLEVLKGNRSGTAPKARLRRLLIVFQFAASIALIIGSLVIYQQLRYVQDKDIGYDRDHVVTMRVRDRALPKQYATLHDELLRHPQIAAVTSSGHLPTNISSSTSLEDWEGSSQGDRLIIYQTDVDYDFLDVFGIELAEGRTFSRAMAGDTLDAILLNETAVRALGWTTGAGKNIPYSDGERRVIGVVKDFHMHSLHQPIQPLMLSLGTQWMSHLSVKVHPDDLPGTLAFLEQTVRRFTAYPFEYQFLDETFDALYKSDLRLGETVGFFTLLALLIAALGLFGLAAYAAEQRTKEIGIRKVLGASIASIVVLLSKEFTQLVLVALVLAAPLAYLGMNRWLEAFAYRIDVSWSLLVAAGGLTLLVALLAVSYQSVRAARVNPADSLKYE